VWDRGEVVSEEDTMAECVGGDVVQVGEAEVRVVEDDLVLPAGGGRSEQSVRMHVS
jgi:hypothetical protein